MKRELIYERAKVTVRLQLKQWERDEIEMKIKKELVESQMLDCLLVDWPRLHRRFGLPSPKELIEEIRMREEEGEDHSSVPTQAISKH